MGKICASGSDHPGRQVKYTFKAQCSDLHIAVICDKNDEGILIKVFAFKFLDNMSDPLVNEGRRGLVAVRRTKTPIGKECAYDVSVARDDSFALWHEPTPGIIVFRTTAGAIGVNIVPPVADVGIGERYI